MAGWSGCSAISTAEDGLCRSCERRLRWETSPMAPTQSGTAALAQEVLEALTREQGALRAIARSHTPAQLMEAVRFGCQQLRYSCSGCWGSEGPNTPCDAPGDEALGVTITPEAVFHMLDKDRSGDLNATEALVVEIELGVPSEDQQLDVIDPNGDNRISLREWIAALEVEASLQPNGTARTLSRIVFEKYLKEPNSRSLSGGEHWWPMEKESFPQRCSSFYEIALYGLFVNNADFQKRLMTADKNEFSQLVRGLSLQHCFLVLSTAFQHNISQKGVSLNASSNAAGLAVQKMQEMGLNATSVNAQCQVDQ